MSISRKLVRDKIRKAHGMAWQKQDYINWVKENIKLH